MPRQMRCRSVRLERLEGQPCQVDTETVATGRDLGRFMATLHQLDFRAFPAMPDQHAVWRRWHGLRGHIAAILGDRLTSSENRRITC